MGSSQVLSNPCKICIRFQWLCRWFCMRLRYPCCLFHVRFRRLCRWSLVRFWDHREVCRLCGRLMRLGGWQDRYAQAACCENFAISDGNRQISPHSICLSRLNAGASEKAGWHHVPRRDGRHRSRPPPKRRAASVPLPKKTQIGTTFHKEPGSSSAAILDKVIG